MSELVEIYYDEHSNINYMREEVTLLFNGARKARGHYTWSNRSWQRFEGQQAFLEMFESLKLPKTLKSQVFQLRIDLKNANDFMEMKKLLSDFISDNLEVLGWLKDLN